MKETEKLEFWSEGVEHFNARRFWHAHESWEKGWLTLPGLERVHVQSLIQLCGVFDLVKRGRLEAALRLAELAHEKLTKVEAWGGIQAVYPRIEVSGFARALRDLTNALAHVLAQASESELEARVERWISDNSLKAELLLSPR